MALNKSKGNMYPFVTHTWNTVKGKCPHDCSYCYMKQFPQKDVRFDEKELNTDLGEGNFIFVGSSCDMFADAIPKDWILETLEHCGQYHKNRYLFQSKNPRRMYELRPFIPGGSIVGTTIESNRTYPQMGLAPSIKDRKHFMNSFVISVDYPFKTMITIEPIMDFDIDELSSIVFACNPEWVNIGADSKGHILPEPSPDKIRALINGLKKAKIEVKVKSNLKRLMGDGQFC